MNSVWNCRFGVRFCYQNKRGEAWAAVSGAEAAAGAAATAAAVALWFKTQDGGGVVGGAGTGRGIAPHDAAGAAAYQGGGVFGGIKFRGSVVGGTTFGKGPAPAGAASAQNRSQYGVVVGGAAAAAGAAASAAAVALW